MKAINKERKQPPSFRKNGMKKALLVDDDFLVRSYLKTLSSWADAGFCIEADVRDGEEALDVLEKAKIHLVVTDIAMPLMDGIQLIREIRKRYKNVYIIVLSCHDDFEHVKKAMQEGADEYVLKNTLEEESLYTMLATAMEHMEEKAQEPELAVAEKPDEDLINKTRMFFNQVLSGTLQGVERERARIKAGIKGRYQNSAVVVMKLKEREDLEDTWADIEREQYCMEFLGRFRKEMNSLLSESGSEKEIIYLGNGVFCCFVDLSDIHKSSVMHQKLTGIASACYKFCRKEVHAFKIGISNICLGAEGLRQAYEQARTMIKLCFYESDSIAYYEAGKRVGHELPAQAEVFLSRVDMFKYGSDKQAFLKMARDVIAVFQQEKTESRMVLQWLKRIQRAAGIYEEVDCGYIENVSEVEAVVVKLGNRIFECESIPVSEHVSNPVRIAAEYAAGHFREPIGLGNAADAVGVNSAYLSYLFSQEMGIGFSNYLLNLRIEHAKKLLKESNLKMREVAEKSGFNDYHYFSKVFKKMNGVSPAEYGKEQKRRLH